MNRSTRIRLSAILAWGLAVSAPASPSGAVSDGPFERFAAEYLQAFYAAHPVRASKLGIHDHDSRLPDLSRAAIRRRVGELREWSARLQGIDRDLLAEDAHYDSRILERAILAELLELEELRGWQHNPLLYNRLMADSVASLIDRQFAPLEHRLSDLISRLKRFPSLMRAARKNLHEVPAAWTELALANARGQVKFLRGGVPAALRAQGLERLDPRLVARFRTTHARALRQLEEFVRWLERDLMPRSTGDFRLGPELFERKLLYEEHVSESVAELTRINEAAIDKYRKWVADEAARLDPTHSVEHVMRSVTDRYPAPEELISVARRNVEQARDFVREHGIVTLPTDELPIVRNTPEYARQGFASMSTPGPFETVATEAYYNITNVDPTWTEQQQRQHLTYFNYAGLLGISIHEAMPGHFVQLLYQRRLPTDVRKVFAPSSLIEGWAHYVEQMMIDEGFGDHDPGIRLGQLRRALQRHARWYAGIALHTSDITVEQAAERFAEIAYFAPFPAQRETLRGTYNPTYLYYALGRMRILELREDYRRHVESRGDTFSLREFHDRFLHLGLPISMAREVMIPAVETGRSAAGDPQSR